MLTNNPSTNEVNQGLDSVIKESKIVIDDELQKKSKGRGRPKKDGTASTNDKTKQSNFVNPTAQPMPVSKDQYKNVLGGILDMANIYLNKYTGTEIFTLSKEEREAITEMGGQTMSDFMPSINPVYMNAIGFACVMGGIYGMKYQAYVEFAKTQKQKSDIVVEVKK
jgi:hypothetical protein